MVSIFAISSHKYAIKLYSPGHLAIIWELFAKKSADILSFRISFITISTQIKKEIMDPLKWLNKLPTNQMREKLNFLKKTEDIHKVV